MRPSPASNRVGRAFSSFRRCNWHGVAKLPGTAIAAETRKKTVARKTPDRLTVGCAKGHGERKSTQETGRKRSRGSAAVFWSAAIHRRTPKKPLSHGVGQVGQGAATRTGTYALVAQGEGQQGEAEVVCLQQCEQPVGSRVAASKQTARRQRSMVLILHRKGAADGLPGSPCQAALAASCSVSRKGRSRLLGLCSHGKPDRPATLYGSFIRPGEQQEFPSCLVSNSAMALDCIV